LFRGPPQDREEPVGGAVGAGEDVAVLLRLQ
jgi:hypothetical protein